MKVLVTGAAGMLGSDLCSQLVEKHEVVATDLPSGQPTNAGAPGALQLDVTQPGLVRAWLGEARPEAVIHCAAWTDVDGCEQEPERAFAVNAVGAWNVASACREIGAKLLHVSTDFVFDGGKGEPYDEFDSPHPISRYGASKLLGEHYVRALVPAHWIVRTAWLYGLRGRNFVETILRVAQGKEEIRVVSDQVGSPTYTADLAGTLCELLENPVFGTYHIVNGGSCSRAEYAEAILRLAAVGSRPPVKVVPVSSREFPLPAARPRNSSLRPLMLEMQGRKGLRPWPEALAAYLAARKCLSS